MRLDVYAVKHKDDFVRNASRSGGIFSALSDKILENGGIVYGCVLDKSFNAIHVRADNKEVRDQMRGSKYIQSKIGDTYKKVQNDLEGGKEVLFSGTSCQVAGLKKFLRREYEKLLCVDIVCHGVPSPAVWHNYIEWLEKQKGKKIIGVDFRNKKKFGWAAHVETFVFNDGSVMNSEIFKSLFLSIV